MIKPQTPRYDTGYSDYLVAELLIGRVVSQAAGSGFLSVRPTGTASRAITQVRAAVGIEYSKHDEVLLARAPNNQHWIAIAKIGSALQVKGTDVLHIPQNFIVRNLFGFSVAEWEAWPGSSICYEVIHNTLPNEDGTETVFYTRGSYCVSQEAGSRYFRARAVIMNPDTGQAFYSGWTAWEKATISGTDFTDLADTPTDYTGHANKLVAVDVSELGLEFVISPSDVDMVDGYHASSDPTPGYLLPLDENTKFPSEVIPSEFLPGGGDFLPRDGTLPMTGDLDMGYNNVVSVSELDGHELADMTIASNEPGGFPNRTDSTLSWVAGTRTFTIAPTATSFDVWQTGIRYTISASEDIIIADTNGLHVVYYDAGVLSQILGPSHTQMDDIIINKVVVALVYWNTNTNEAPLVADERHGCQMSGRTHEYLHDTRGAVYRDGLTLSDYLEDTDSDVALTFQVTDGEIYDEDLEVEIENGVASGQYKQQLNGGDAEVSVLYRDNIDGTWKELAASTLPYLTTGSGRLAYNLDDGDGTYSQAEVTNFRWMSYTLVATNDWQYPVKMIQGQNEYTSMASAIEDATNEILSFGDLPTPEMVILYRLVMRTGSTYGGTKKAEISSVTDFRASQISGISAAAQDHGSLGGLSDDDHAQYLLLDGSRPLTNTGLHVLDTDASHDLLIVPGSDLTADRTLTLVTGDADRTITLQGNPTLDDWFDQAVKGASSVDFAQVTLPDSGKFIVGTGGDGEIYSSSDDVYIKNVTQDKDIYIQVNDGGVTKTPIFLQGTTGYVGINGMLSPEAPMHVLSESTVVTDNIFIADKYAGIAQGVGFNFRRARGSFASPADLVSADTVSIQRSRAYVNSAFQIVANIQVIAETVTALVASGKYSIKLADTSGVLQNRFVITEDGYTGSSEATPLDVLHVGGAVLREGWFMGQPALQTAFTGVLTDIDIDTERREDSDYYTHAAGSDDITFVKAGDYRISYCFNIETDDSARTDVRVGVYDDDVLINGSRSTTYTRIVALGGQNSSVTNSFLAIGIAAGSIIDFRTDASQGGAYGIATADYDITADSQVTIERVDE